MLLGLSVSKSIGILRFHWEPVLKGTVSFSSTDSFQQIKQVVTYLRHHARLIRWRIMSWFPPKEFQTARKTHALLNSIQREIRYNLTADLRSVWWRSFALVHFVNVRRNRWFCYPILLIILVKELGNRTTHVSNGNFVTKPIRGTVALLTIPIPLVPFRQYRYRTVSC